MPEKEVLPRCERENIGQIVWSPLIQGVLTGKYKPGHPPPPNSRAASKAMSTRFNDQGISLQGMKVLKAVQQIAPIKKTAA